MRRPPGLLLSLLMAAGSAAAAVGTSRVVLTIDPGAPGKIYDGIGATSTGIIRLLIDYPEPQRSQILDYLFKPQYGASLQQLKVEIGGDGNSNAGSEPSSMHSRADANFARGVGWWLMREARRRNPQIKLTALAWNFPGWVERGYSPATVEYLRRYLEGAERTAGITIDYVGIWNETKMDPRFITDLRRSLDEHGLATKIVADDLVNTWDIVEAMERDAALRAAVAVMGTHYPQPRFVTPDGVKRASRDWGKPVQGDAASACARSSTACRCLGSSGVIRRVRALRTSLVTSGGAITESASNPFSIGRATSC